jgi:hypothetical protein
VSDCDKHSSLLLNNKLANNASHFRNSEFKRNVLTVLASWLDVTIRWFEFYAGCC